MAGHIASTARKQKEIDVAAQPVTWCHPTFRVCFPTSTNPAYKPPHPHAQRLVSKTLLDPVKLAISVHHHIKVRPRSRNHLSEAKTSSLRGHAVLPHQNLPSRSLQTNNGHFPKPTCSGQKKLDNHRLLTQALTDPRRTQVLLSLSSQSGAFGERWYVACSILEEFRQSPEPYCLLIITSATSGIS